MKASKGVSEKMPYVRVSRIGGATCVASSDNFLTSARLVLPERINETQRIALKTINHFIQKDQWGLELHRTAEMIGLTIERVS